MAGGDGDEVWNRSQPWNRFFLERIPAENAATGLNSVPYYSVLRPNEYPFASSSTNIPPCRVSTSGLSREIYHAVPAPSSSTDFLTNQLQQEPSSNPLMMHNDEFGFVGQMDRRSSSFKRKWSSNPVVCDARNTTGYCSGESSYSHIQQKAASDSHRPSWNFNMISNSQGIEYSQQGSWRNVRCKHSNAVCLDADSIRSHSRTGFQSQFNLPGDLPGPSTERQWNHGAFATSSCGAPAGSGAFTSEIDLHLPGSSSRHFLCANNGQPSSVHCRNVSFPFAVHGPFHGMGESSSYHVQRAPPPWRLVPGPFSPNEVSTTSSDWDNQLVSEDLRVRSMSVSINGGQRIGERSRRIRDSYGTLQPHEVRVDTHRRWMHQDFASMDRGLLYGNRHQDRRFDVNNMRGLLYDDQHQDMRLDIDNMGYEELLALGERIGNVNTGLTDDMISECLTRTIHSCSMGKVQEEMDGENCIICLESYKVGEELGCLKCGHEYHFCCIKRWLQIKNSCPICKVSALER